MSRKAIELRWLAAGTFALCAIFGLLVYLQGGATTRTFDRAQRARLVARMRADLASAVADERSAVMAASADDGHRFAVEARAALASLQNERDAIAPQLVGVAERAALAQFDQSFDVYRRIDGTLLELVEKSSNLKATALAFGPAQDALFAFDDALAELSNGPTYELGLHAANARAAALRIAVLLPPHIAEEGDARMDRFEAAMGTLDDRVRKELATLGSTSRADAVARARTAYDRFTTLRREILTLSRENSNVRALSLSLHEQRNATLLCREALEALEDAIGAEPMPKPPRAR